MLDPDPNPVLEPEPDPEPDPELVPVTPRQKVVVPAPVSQHCFLRGAWVYYIDLLPLILLLFLFSSTLDD
jgi:hypothetical protein